MRSTPKKFDRALSVLVAGAGLAVGIVGASADPIREGTGERRAALDSMELKAFDQSLWSKLSNWYNGDPVTASSTDGKVVVIYTFASYLNSSMSPMVGLDRLRARYADEGLMVVGVHHPQGFEGSEAQVKRRRVGFPVAHDATGAFREALRVDQDPDIYIIDRAGQLRYADIETGSVDEAVKTLIAETASRAGSTLERRAEAKRQADLDARRSASLRSQIDLANLPDVPFIPPTPEEYESVKWPTMYEYRDLSRGQQNDRDREEDSPRGIDIPDDARFAPAPPRSRDGRVTMVYFWTPEQGMASWNEFYDALQAIQREHARDLVMIGAAVMGPEERGNRRGRGNDDARDKRVREAKERFDSFFSKKPLNHVLMDDMDSGALMTSVTGDGGRRGRSDPVALPYAGLISSDGQLRWHGHLGVDYEEFRDALDRLLRDDPGLKARRAAEERYINEVISQQEGGG